MSRETVREEALAYVVNVEQEMAFWRKTGDNPGPRNCAAQNLCAYVPVQDKMSIRKFKPITKGLVT